MVTSRKIYRKREHEKVVRINITLTPTLLDHAERIIAQHGYTGPSDYFSNRIRIDAGLVLAKAN
jgi:hypothetical protein